MVEQGAGRGEIKEKGKGEAPSCSAQATHCHRCAHSAGAMVLVTDVLVPLRFLALIGHFFASLLAMYAVVRVCNAKKEKHSAACASLLLSHSRRALSLSHTAGQCHRRAAF